MKTARGYDQLAWCYRLVETLAFGRALEWARFAHLPRLQDRRHILLLGDGDGRVLARVCRLAPHARIETLDISAGMLARAARRLSPADRARVTWRHEDARAATFAPSSYDAIVTLFFFDCFSNEEVRVLINRLRPALMPNALWLEADFALPARGPARWRAHVWLAAMQAFFRWQTGLQARELPPVGALHEDAGLRKVAGSKRQGGFIRSTVFGSLITERRERDLL